MIRGRWQQKPSISLFDYTTLLLLLLLLQVLAQDYADAFNETKASREALEIPHMFVLKLSDRGGQVALVFVDRIPLHVPQKRTGVSKRTLQKSPTNTGRNKLVLLGACSSAPGRAYVRVYVGLYPYTYM